MQSIQSFSPGVLVEIIRRQPASKEKTSFAWQIAVGPALARATSVELRDGVLIVRAKDEHWQKEIRRASSAILPKMQHLLGESKIHSITSYA